MDDQRTVLTRRITFAEDWLARARRQVEDGEQARGILTLLIAEAEVHRARDLGTGHADTMPVRAGQRLGPFAAVAVAVAIVATIALSHPFGPLAWSTAAAGEVSPHPIVTLSGGNDSMLRLVQAPQALERTVTVPVAVQVMVRIPASPLTVERAVDRPAGAPAPVRPTAAQPAPRRPEVPAAAALPPTVSESSALLSEAELIDLVLATERSLRRATNQ
ncbi:MAG: hypothetical protein ACRDIC_06725 [bacterium]